jgi:hypothetical protein
MLRIIAISAMLMAPGCNNQRLFKNSGQSGAIPGEAIKAYAEDRSLSPQEARQAMIADNLTSRGASLPKEALQP